MVTIDKLLGDALMHTHDSSDVSLDSRYLQLAGVSGGQLAIGGTGIADILKLQGTTGNGTSTSPAIQLLTGNNGATTAVTVLNNGNVGIGTTAPTKKLHIEDTSNNTYTLYAHNTTTNNDVGTVYLPAGLFSELDSTNNNAAVSSQYSSIYSTLRYRGSHSLDNNANRAVNGIFNSVFNYNTGTTDWVSGFYTDIRNLGTSSVYGDITNLAVYRAITPALSGGTVTNAYGMYLDGMYTSGRTTNAYGIYQAGASDKNYFAGNVGIGTTAPLSQLNLDTGSVAAGLYNGILVNGTNPGMGLRVDRSSGGAAAKLLRMYLRNTSSTNETQMGAIGFFGTADATPTVDYVWIGADTNSEYNLASFRVYKEYIQSTRIHGLFFKPTADGTAAFRFVTNASETGYLLVGDTTNMRVSINGATPLATLDVRGSASGITSIFKAHATTPGDLTQWQNSSGTVLACVTGTGNVGIGTTAPDGKLHAIGSASGITAVLDSNATTPGDILQLRNSSETVYHSFSLTGVVFNEGGIGTTDFRVESDTEANMLFLDANGNTDGTLYIGGNSATTSNSSRKGGLFFPVQAPTASAPAYVKGAIYFDTTLNKLRIGGAAGWETVTSA